MKKISLECLEDRSVPASFATGGGTLAVTGTDGNDDIHLAVVAGQLELRDNGVLIGAFDASQIDTVLVVGGEGDDLLVADNSVAALVYLYGNQGNDYLQGGGGFNVLDGGSEDDTFVGGNGTNFMRGYEGHDMFQGGAGADYVMDDEVQTGFDWFLLGL